MTAKIAPIVEGHGELDAVPILIRRIGRSIDPGLALEVLRPTRKSRGTLLRPGVLETEVKVASVRLQGEGGILVLIDADDDCPREKAPELLSRARSARSDVPMAVVLALREYEAWFLEAAESLRGRCGLPVDLSRPTDTSGRSRAEEIRGAKGWLGERMHHRYRETEDQPALTHHFSLTLARRARSFDKCYRELVGMLRRLTLVDASMDADEAALCCARRFDSVAHSQATGFDPWPGIERFLATGVWELSPAELWATFARLEVGLCRWRIEQEPRYNGLWRAFRSLFLLVSESEPPPAFQVASAEAEWRVRYQPDLAYYVELLREVHEQAVYENGN